MLLDGRFHVAPNVPVGEAHTQCFSTGAFTSQASIPNAGTTDAAAADAAAGSAGQRLEAPDHLRAVHALTVQHLAASATRARRGTTIAVTDVPGHHTTNGVSDAAVNSACIRSRALPCSVLFEPVLF